MKDSRQSRHEPFKSLDDFSLFDLECVRLILQGGSVLDWGKFNPTPAEIDAFCRVHQLDLENTDDVALIERIRDEAVAYLRETLSFPVPRPVRSASLVELLRMAGDGSTRHRQLCACTLLKAMHVINHFDANEARQALAMTDQELFLAAERRIYRTVSNMMALGMPIVEFMGGRKQRTSMVTKLLSKSTPLSTQLFDKMRFRIITTDKADVLPIINYLERNLFPFNYVLASESYNTLFPFADHCATNKHLSSLLDQLQIDSKTKNRLLPLSNKHSSSKYRVVHWVADMPIKVPDFTDAFRTDGVNPIPRPIVYLRTELQILDRRSHRQNERSDASHSKYKERQIESVAERLKVGLRKFRDLDIR
jgi:uncharacterized protein (TIGR04552 family)